jgi:hypothetical protein
MTPTTLSHPVPFADTPLFGPLDLEPGCLVSESSAWELPSRVEVEGLADIYFNASTKANLSWTKFDSLKASKQHIVARVHLLTPRVISD